jgi:hypothetical protein
VESRRLGVDEDLEDNDSEFSLPVASPVIPTDSPDGEGFERRDEEEPWDRSA